MFRNKKIQTFLVLLARGLFYFYLYSFLHESGHALLAILCGGKVDKMVIGFGAYVQTSGANFTPLSSSVFYAAGALLPLLLLLPALLFYRPSIKNEYYHFFYGLYGIGIIGSLLPWLILPVANVFGKSIPGDDVTKFLSHSGVHPLLLSTGAFILISLLLIITWKIGLIWKFLGFYKNIFAVYRGSKPLKSLVMRWFLAIAVIIGISTATFYFLRPRPILNTSVSLEINQPIQTHTIAFNAAKSKDYRMNLELVSAGFITDIQLFNENGERIYQNLAEWINLSSRIFLEKGNYEMVLTFLPDYLQLEHHWALMGYPPEGLEPLTEFYRDDDAGPRMITFTAGIRQ